MYMSSPRRTFLHLIAVTAMSAAAIAVTAAPSRAADLGDHLVQGQHMNRHDFIERTTRNGSVVRLTLQGDGNLVLRNMDTGRACWAAGTNPSGNRAYYQGDGNFVVRNKAMTALWASGRQPGTTVDMNSAGTLFVGWEPISPPCGD
jgi:hypothetical protein